MGERNQELNRWHEIGRAFPTIQRAFGETPFNAIELEEWARYTKDANALHAARFVLLLRARDVDWKCGRVDIETSMAAWDPVHRKHLSIAQRSRGGREKKK